MTYLNATSRGSFSLRKSPFLYENYSSGLSQKHFVTRRASVELTAKQALSTAWLAHQDHFGLHRHSRLRLARKRAHPLSTSQLGPDIPLLRIGDPSPYATVCGGSSDDPTVLQALRSYPLSCYKPKHDPGPLVASDTSLAGAQTTPPETLLSSPNHKKLQKPPICRTFTRIPSAQNIPTLRKARFATSPRAGQSPARNQKKHAHTPPQRESHHPPNPKQHHRGEPSTTGDPL
jgi:hypothetical protein